MGVLPMPWRLMGVPPMPWRLMGVSPGKQWHLPALFDCTDLCREPCRRLALARRWIVSVPLCLTRNQRNETKLEALESAVGRPLKFRARRPRDAKHERDAHATSLRMTEIFTV
jgi:hypothetical protein